MNKLTVRGAVVGDWYREALGKADLEMVIIEALKNAFDWSASQVRILTSDRRCIRFVDDGCGMNASNMASFVSLGRESGKGLTGKSARFCSGMRHFIFSFASHVRVVTVTEEAPDIVTTLEFTPGDLERMYTGKLDELAATKQRKTSENWVHPHPFGTEIELVYATPESSKILRGEKLARALSDRLDSVMAAVVTVDDQPLPPREMVGRLYSYELPEGQNPHLGRVRFEFWHPAKSSKRTTLLMTDRTFGEVDFRSRFLRLLREDQEGLVSPIYLNREVCGLIVADFLNGYVVEKRDSYDPAVADDERVTLLLQLMKTIELDVADRLGLKLPEPPESMQGGEAEIQEVMDRIKRIYGTVKVGPDGPGLDEEDDTDKPVKPGTPRRPPSPRIVLNQPEFQVGEEIRARLSTPGEEPGDYRFYLEHSGGVKLAEEPGFVRLRATRIGRCLIFARNLSKGRSVEAEYEVVNERMLTLAPLALTVKVGAEVAIKASNTDKVLGQIIWDNDGLCGSLNYSDDRTKATFKAEMPGSTDVVVYDSARPTIRLVCRIIVTREWEEELLVIEGEKFRRGSAESRVVAHGRPVTILVPPGTSKGSGRVHTMIFNPLSPGYQRAQQCGCLANTLLLAIAGEYVSKFETPYTDMAPDDVIQMMDDVQVRTFELYEKLLGGK